MAVDFRTVDVKFTEGQDTRTQRKLVVAGKWDTLLNYSLSEDNTPERRDGTSVYLTSNGNGLIQRGNELLQVSGGSAVAVNSTIANSTMAVPGELPFVDISKAEVDFTSGFHDSPDVAYGNGYACYVWIDRDASTTVVGPKVTVVDVASGTKLVSAALLSSTTTAVSTRVVFTGSAFHIFFIDTPSIFCSVILTSAPTTVGAATSVQLDANISPKNFDACRYLSASLVSYVYTDGATSVRSIQITNAATVPSVLQGPTNVISEANVTNASIQALTCAPYTGEAHAGVFIVHTAGGALGGGLVGAVLDTLLSVSTGATLLDGTVPPVAAAAHVTAASKSSTSMAVFFDQQSSYNTANLRPLRGIVVTAALGITIAATTVLRSATFRVNGAEASGPQGPFIAGKAFVVGSSTFMPVAMLENFSALGANTATTNAQNSWFLIDVTSFVNGAVSNTLFAVVASALYGSYGFNCDFFGSIPPTVSTPCSVAGPTSAGGYLAAVQERPTRNVVNGFIVSPIGISSLTMVPRTASGSISSQLGESTYVAGGQLANYDGRQLFQHGFPNFPEGISAVKNASGTGSVTVGTHQIVAVYEWTDGAGNRHQSAPSLAVAVTSTLATDQFDVIIPTTQLPQFSGTMNIVCYMTAAAGNTFFRANTFALSPVINNTTVSTVTINLGAIGNFLPDGKLTANELLYTQPDLPAANSTLPNLAPGPVAALCEGNSRVWYIKADQPLAWGFSQRQSTNTGLQFNDSLGGTLPLDSGGAVAVAFLDEKVVFFGRRRIYYVTGNPPDAGGSNNGLSDPVDIQSDVGCSDARSVLGEIPQGIIFKSQQGWHLLGRDLSVTYIGAGVSRFDAFSVTSAVLMQDRKEARFTLSNGVSLVYSTLLGEWSYFVYGQSFTTGYIAADAAWWPALNKYVWTSITDGMNADTPGATNDLVGTHALEKPFTVARTGFLKLSAMEGFQRVRRLYVTATASNISTLTSTLSLIVYFNDSYTDPAVNYFVQVSTDALGAPTAESVDFRHEIQKLQKCKSIAFEFQDIAFITASTPLSGIQALALEVGVKKGVNRLKASQTV